MLALPLLLSAASLAIAAPSFPQRRDNDGSQATTTVDYPFGHASTSVIAVASTGYASYDAPSSAAVAQTTWAPSAVGGGCSPVTVTMMRGAAATATVVASSAFGSSDESSSYASSWSSSANNGSSYEPIYTIQTDTELYSASSGPAVAATTTSVIDYSTASASLAKRQLITSYASAEGLSSADDDAEWATTTLASGAVISEASASFAASGSAPIAEAPTSTVSAWESAVATDVLSSVSASPDYYTSTASAECAPTVTVWVDSPSSATATGFVVSSTGVSITGANQTASRAQAQQNAKPASGASSTFVSSGAALLAVGAALVMV